MQRANIIRMKIESICIDSTIVKVHPDATKMEFKALSEQEADLQQKFIWLLHLSERV
jgi:hypothetical protein